MPSPLTMQQIAEIMGWNAAVAEAEANREPNSLTARVLRVAAAAADQARVDYESERAKHAVPIAELQAEGKAPAPCAKFCEAPAFQAMLRNLQPQADAAHRAGHALGLPAGTNVTELPAAVENLLAERDDWRTYAKEAGAQKVQATLELQEVKRQRDVLLEALEKSRAVFDSYVQLHRDKTPPDEEKAARNAFHRGVCDEAIASVKGGAL